MAVKKKVKVSKKPTTKKKQTKKPTTSKPKQLAGTFSDQNFLVLKAELIRDKDFMKDFFLENLGFVNGKIQITNADSPEEVILKIKAKGQLTAYNRTLDWMKEIEDNKQMYIKITNSGLARGNAMLTTLENDIKGAMKTNKELADAFRSQSYPNSEKGDNDPLVVTLETENNTFNEILKKIDKANK